MAGLFDKKLHLHSMIVHAVAALAPLAAFAFIMQRTSTSLGMMNEHVWSFIVVFSLIMMLLVTFPSALTGVFERDHRYAQWHFTHKMKLTLSWLLIIVLTSEIVGIMTPGINKSLWSWFGIFVIFINNIIVGLLSFLGLKITLGRQSIGSTSYKPDMMKKPAVDILETAAAYRKEEPKVIDIYKGE